MEPGATGTHPLSARIMVAIRGVKALELLRGLVQGAILLDPLLAYALLLRSIDFVRAPASASDCERDSYSRRLLSTICRPIHRLIFGACDGL